MTSLAGASSPEAAALGVCEVGDRKGKSGDGSKLANVGSISRGQAHRGPGSKAIGEDGIDLVGEM
jgi:hypothetical protein